MYEIRYQQPGLRFRTMSCRVVAESVEEAYAALIRYDERITMAHMISITNFSKGSIIDVWRIS